MELLPGNSSLHQHFLLSSFEELGPLRPVLFLPFFVMFLVSLSANVLLLYVIISHRSLHSPMYLLIAAMAVVDLSLPLFFASSMLLNFLFGWRGISLIGCLAQMFFLHMLGAYQSTILVWMSLDRYFAILSPLHYHDLMAGPRFLKLVVPFFIRNVVMVSVVVALAGALPFCRSDVIEHCFCEHMALVELACGSTTVNSLVGLMSVFLITITDFITILVFYVVIFSSVLRSGRSGVKALHTCVTHIVVFTVNLTIVLIAFLSYRIRNDLPADFRVFFSIMYLFFPGCFNPIIYGVRTKEIWQQVLKILGGSGSVQPDLQLFTKH